MYPRKPRVFHSQKSEGGSSPKRKTPSSQKNFRIKYTEHYAIPIADRMKVEAIVLHLNDGRSFAIGPEPIDGKQTVYRLGNSGWTRVPLKHAGKIIGGLKEANPEVIFKS